MTFAWLMLSSSLLVGPIVPLLTSGSGTALPAVRALAFGYRGLDPSFSLKVAASIGTTGAVLAVHDGAIAVGLISRPLKPSESEGLCVIPFASDLVVAATSPDVKVSALTSAELVQIFQGDLTVWPGSDPPLHIHVLQREAGDSGSEVLASKIPGLGESLQQALEQGRWRVLFDDAEMQQALLQSKGAIGLFDLGAIRSQNLALRALTLDGATPTPEAAEKGSYPYAETLAFIVKANAPREDRLEAFLAFAVSPKGRATLKSAGYLPPPSSSETCH